MGDGKVRSSHADRDGKTFSWDDPPEGGHPGEALNCRCTAEDIVDKKRCEELSRLIKAMEVNLKKARERYTKAAEKFNSAQGALNNREHECETKREEAGRRIIAGGFIGGIIGNAPGVFIGAGDAALASVDDIYDACIKNVFNSQEKVDYEKARQELKSAEFWKNAHQEDWKAYRDEYEQIGCRA